MKLALPIVLLMPTLLVAPPVEAQEARVTQTLSLIVYYYEDASKTAANINRNILPPPPTTESPGGSPPDEEPAPTPLPPPAPVDCPTLYLPAANTRAQVACKMADDLPGARCVRLWSGITLVVEPFD